MISRWISLVPSYSRSRRTSCETSGRVLESHRSGTDAWRTGLARRVLARRAELADLRYTDPAPSGVVVSDGASAGSSLGPFRAFGSGQ